tara:strand:- start:15017 stop:15484 length:468 start_codon:yes stop_codon:yes gene_type:complete
MTAKSGPRFNKETRKLTRKKLYTLLEQGVDIDHAADECGISISYAYKIAKKYEWPYNKVTKIVAEQIMKSFSYGYTASQISSIYNMAKAKVEEVIHNNSGHQRKETITLSTAHSVLERQQASRSKENTDHTDPHNKTEARDWRLYPSGRPKRDSD